MAQDPIGKSPLEILLQRDSQGRLIANGSRRQNTGEILTFFRAFYDEEGKIIRIIDESQGELVRVFDYHYHPDGSMVELFYMPQPIRKTMSSKTMEHNADDFFRRLEGLYEKEYGIKLPDSMAFTSTADYEFNDVAAVVYISQDKTHPVVKLKEGSVGHEIFSYDLCFYKPSDFQGKNVVVVPNFGYAGKPQHASHDRFPKKLEVPWIIRSIFSTTK